MNRFIKTNSPWLSLLGLAVAIVILTFIFRPKSLHYQTGADESLKLMNNPSMEVAIKDIAGKQLIDIRTTELFLQGHPNGAVNIPVRQLLDKESLDLFEQLSKKGETVILYGVDQLQATAPLFLLQQLGYKNLKLLKGGINTVNEFTPPEPGLTEVSVVDTALIHSKADQINAPLSSPVIKKREAVLPVRKVVSAGGGC